MLDPDLLARFRRMVAEPTDATYSDEVLSGYVEALPLLDEMGAVPFTWSYSTNPPTKVANAAWIPTYDLNAAAAEVWQEKAGALSERYDFKADGGDFAISQAYDHAVRQTAYYRQRRAARTASVPLSPPTGGGWRRDGYIGNLPEE